MTPFSGRAQQSVRGLATRLGIGLLPGDARNPCFRFDSGCAFTLTPVAEGSRIIASLIFRPRSSIETIQERLFDQADREWQEGRLLQPGITPQHEIVLAVSIDDETMSVQLLDDVLRRLLELRAGL